MRKSYKWQRRWEDSHRGFNFNTWWHFYKESSRTDLWLLSCSTSQTSVSANHYHQKKALRMNWCHTISIPDLFACKPAGLLLVNPFVCSPCWIHVYENAHSLHEEMKSAETCCFVSKMKWFRVVSPVDSSD